MKAVFLSYASQDAEAAQRICESLRAARIEVWFDQNDLRGGDVWDHHIRRQIADCALFVPIISAHTQSRPEGYFRLEWDLADQRSHMIARTKAFILPVCIDATPERGAEVPETFLKVQWTRIPSGVTPLGFVERVARLLSPEAAAAAEHVASTVGARPERATTLLRAIGITVPLWRSRAARLLIAASAIIAVVYFAVDRLMLPKYFADRSPASAPTAPPSTPAQSTIPEKSIAVLPFVDMSEKHDQEYFSDGLSEELIDLLTKVPDLRVPARTSSFYFKGRQTTISDIAKTLHVAHVLEGSVRKAGNTVRITAQLIRVVDGYHVWSQTYDRDLNDIFLLQDEIAGKVVQVLKATLLTYERNSDTPTIGPEAYNLYLQARFAERQGTPADVQAAIELYQKVVVLQPTLAVAWAHLSELHAIQANFFGAPHAKAYRQAREAATRALMADPLLPEAHVAMGDIYSKYDWNWASADIEFTRALELNPNDQSALLGYGNFAKTMGRRTEASRILRQAVERDPLRGAAHGYLGWALWLEGNLAEAEFEYRKTLELAPRAFLFHSFVGRIMLERGQREAALAEIQQEPQSEVRLQALVTAYYAMGQRAESDRLLAQLVGKDGSDPRSQVNIAAAYAERGEVDKAFDWLQRGYEQRDPGITGLLDNPFLKSISGDPRYRALLRKMNLPVGATRVSFSGDKPPVNP